MAEGKARAGGDYFPLTREISPMIVPPLQLELKAKPSTSKPVQSLTPRGQRFIKLAGPALSTIASSRLAKSQDDLQTPGSASAMRSCMKKNRRASVDFVDFIGGLPPRMGRRDKDRLRLSLTKQIENEVLDLNAQSHDTTSSTIEGILAQYDGRTSSLKAENGKSREYRVKTELSISQPPQGSLPEAPPTNMQSTSNVRQSEYDSPVPDSSITDSQHLLDAEAQAHELEEARRALVPLPLKIVQPRHGIEIPREQHHDTLNNKGAFIVYKGEPRSYNPFVNRKDECYKTYLQPPMERDISQKLRRASGYAEHGASASYSPHVDEDLVLRQERPQGKIFSQSSLPTVTPGEKPLRHIKVVIGREPVIRHNNQDHNCLRVDAEDGDWVTEATSDAGFGFTPSPLPGRHLTGGPKKAGSSLADYSDDDCEDMADRFGSHERIIQHLGGDDQYKSYNVRRSNGSKFAVLLPRRYNALPDNVGRRWGSTTQQEAGQFRHQILRKGTNPYREVSSKRSETSGRLFFDFDQNAPPRYEFRDSISEYEPATASSKANCGTQKYDTNGSLLSPVSYLREENRPSTTDAHFEQSADFDADRNASDRFSQPNKACQARLRSQDTRFSIDELNRRKQLEEVDKRRFASASSYYDPPSANSVRSKFNFELLPLNLAQQKNKRQRNSGETNETETTTARLKRKQSVRSINPETSPLEPPTKVFFTSPELSLNFSSPNWQTRNLDPEDTPTPFAMGRLNRAASGPSRKYRKVSSLGFTDNSSSLSTQSVTRRLCYNKWERRLEQAENRPWRKPRPGLIAPDDYVSDRADSARQSCFCLLVILSILPFVGVLALSGAFSEAFKWATRGEVDRLTTRQRRFIKWMLLAECILYTGGVVTVVVYFAVKGKAQN
ncbi:hypothetical protein E0Z10_g5473 [Xylaria hypoxylon]|uniref:Uncharacterized protein n=1 Tax=Xylaria hypoxylon TaxID=37992 RepID=A0A4Z0YVS0_9PEZI|nr:hypothetical protein E0Z10_g5473 [Xylaria hypoxylon]